MTKLAIKILDKTISFEAYERMGYLIDYDLEYDEVLEYIEAEKMIPLDMDEEEFEEDMEALDEMKKELEELNIAYEIHELDEAWRLISKNIPKNVHL